MKRVLILLLIFTIYSGHGQGILFDSYKFVSCAPDPNEKATDLNAANDPNCTEADSTAGWAVYSGDAVITSAGTDVYCGASKIVITTPTGTSSSVTYSIADPTNGSTYTVTFWARTNGGCDATMSAWINCTGGPAGVDVTTTWTQYTYNITTTNTWARLRFYPDGGGESGCGAPGDTIEIDCLSIIKTS
ncbi:hypothetical protein C7967_11560 [Thalassospira sp. 11-3]|nr:hypothetical protein C7967_11560 [Thalassospira sp. 11-3]